jgi:branched-chain amino acid transport system permease protein
MILRTQHLRKHFGGIVALDDVSMEFCPGTVTAVVGSNGAGKSTLFNVVTGMVVPDSGLVLLGDGDGVRLNGLQPYVIARHGVGVLFQDVRVFRKLTALENVALGAPLQAGERAAYALFRRSAASVRDREVVRRATQLLDLVGLADRAHVWAENLSHGQQKLVALARLMASESSILLLDEPTAGLQPGLVDEMLAWVRRLADDYRRTVIMIEHSREAVARVSDRVYRLERGAVVGAGNPSAVLAAWPRRTEKNGSPCLVPPTTPSLSPSAARM